MIWSEVSENPWQPVAMMFCRSLSARALETENLPVLRALVKLSGSRERPAKQEERSVTERAAPMSSVIVADLIAKTFSFLPALVGDLIVLVEIGHRQGVLLHEFRNQQR